MINKMTKNKSGWNNKNTLDFRFDKNGLPAIFNLDNEIVEDAVLEDSPLCQCWWKIFKEKYPNKHIYENEIKELKKLSSEDIQNIIQKINELLMKTFDV